MKKLVLGAVLVVAWSAGIAADPPAAQTFHGEISDSSCAMNVHSLSNSHEEMLKRKTTGTDPASCARYCVKNLGGSFVLVTKKNVYHLANDEKAEPFAGEKVVVRGVLDKKNATISMLSIDHETSKPQAAR